MKLGWIHGGTLAASLDGDTWRDVTAILAELPAPSIDDGHVDWLISHLPRVREAVARAIDGAPKLTVNDATAWLSPVRRPGKIVGIPVNYQDHVDEVEQARQTFTNRYTGSIRQQGFFLKASSSLVGPSEGIAIRFPERETHHELELAVVIGRRADRVRPEDAAGYIAGYCIGLDMVVRGPEDRSMRKSLDSYSVLGPWLTTADQIADPGSLFMWLDVNGSRRQSCYPRDMIMGIAEQIAWISESCTLWPGDVIMTGTSSGVSRVVPGDRIECSIEKLGSMRIGVRSL